MKTLNIIKEFFKLGRLAKELHNTGFYDVSLLINGLYHMLTKNLYFYGPYTASHPSKDPCKAIYDLNDEPNEHQLVSVKLGAGYAKEIRGPHWCYVYKKAGPKLIVIPVTSIKPNSRPVRAPYEIDIEESDGTIARMHLDDIRSIDKMRVNEDNIYIDVVTLPETISDALDNFLNYKK